MARHKDDGIPTKLTVHFSTAEPISQSVNPSPLKTGKSENDLPLCGNLWPRSSKIFSLKVMIQVPSLYLHSMCGHKFSVLRIAETAVGNQVFKLAPFGNGQLFDLTAPDLRVLGIPDDVLQQVISQASQLAQNRTANV